MCTLEPVPGDDLVPPPRPFSWKTPLIFAFVAFQIFIVLLRNPIDLWWKPMEAWAEKEPWWKTVEPSYRFVDRWTERYEKATGVEQGWAMFTCPVARAAPFLTTRLEFDDGSVETLYPANEPDGDFFRVGGWRLRKIEDRLAFPQAETLAKERDLPLWQTYVRMRVREWRRANPDDARTLHRVSLWRRRVPFPPPDQSQPTDDVEAYLVGVFAPDGSLR